MSEELKTPTNWPNPERPGVPMFPERDGGHAFQIPDLEETDIIYHWHQNGGGWTEYNHHGPEDFLTDEDMKGWIYKGPVLTPTQIAEMLAAERERCAIKMDQYKQKVVDDYGSYDPATGITEIASEAANTEIEFYETAAQIIRNLGAAP
ncbi:MAG: hypothetical protein ACTIDN_09770 [Acetobacter sp.]|uniref:hypothetical protein n=1 Tax=Acetobacter sp. TaxID=440 RepID=UPI003F8FB913